MSEIIFAVTMLSAMILSVLIFYTGIKVGRVQEGKPLPRILPKLPNKKPKPNPELEKLSKIISNIDAFDGTARGQIKVE